MLEVYKSRNKLNPEFMWDLFRVTESPYSLRIGEVLMIPLADTIYKVRQKFSDIYEKYVME